MIKAEETKIHLKGGDIHLLSELTLIVTSLNEHLTKKYEDKEQAKYMIEQAVRIGFLSEEEKDKEVKEKLDEMADFIGDFLGDIVERMFK